MSKLLKLKKWISIESAALRLSSTLEETVTSKDIIQLALDGQLRLCCYLRSVPCEEVAFSTTLYNWFGAGEDDPTVPLLKGIIESKSKDEYKNSPLAQKDAIVGFEIVNKKIVYLEGVFEVAIYEFEKTKNWLLSQVLTEQDEGVSIDGIGFFDKNKTLYRRVEKMPIAVKMGESQRFNEKNKQEEFTWTLDQKDFYYPSDVLPELGDLVISREDLDEFEQGLLDQEGSGSNAPRADMRKQKENNYLKTISVLTKVIVGETHVSRPHTAASKIFEKAAAKGITLPIGEELFAKYIEQANKIE